MGLVDRWTINRENAKAYAVDEDAAVGDTGATYKLAEHISCRVEAVAAASDIGTEAAQRVYFLVCKEGQDMLIADHDEAVAAWKMRENNRRRKNGQPLLEQEPANENLIRNVPNDAALARVAMAIRQGDKEPVSIEKAAIAFASAWAVKPST